MAQNSSTVNYPQSGIEFLTGQPNGSRVPESSHACPERSRRERQATNLRALRHQNKPNSKPNDQTFMAKYATFRPKRLSFVPEGTNKPNLNNCKCGLTKAIKKTYNDLQKSNVKKTNPIKPNSNPNVQTFMAKYATFRPNRLSYVPEGTKAAETGKTMI